MPPPFLQTWPRVGAWLGWLASRRTKGDSEFISIPEWGRRLGVSKDSAYKAAPARTHTRLLCHWSACGVNWSAFVERSSLAGGQQPAEEVGGILVPPLDHVGVDPQRGRGVRVA